MDSKMTFGAYPMLKLN